MKNNWRSLMAIWLVAFSLIAVSCIAHIHGNGKVVKEERAVSGFEEISASTGIEVALTQDSFEKVVVEADENIQKILKTEVAGGKLKIYLEEGVNYAKKMKVYVTLKQLKVLEASAGSDVTMEVGCTMVSLDSSSGSQMNVSGTTQSVKAGCSSGANLDASKLVAENGDVSASSGADLDVHVTKDLKAHASSGAGITVYGNPATRDTNSSSGGDVNYK